MTRPARLSKMQRLRQMQKKLQIVKIHRDALQACDNMRLFHFLQ